MVCAEDSKDSKDVNGGGTDDLGDVVGPPLPQPGDDDDDDDEGDMVGPAAPPPAKKRKASCLKPQCAACVHLQSIDSWRLFLHSAE